MFSGYLNYWQPQPSGILRSSDMIIPALRGEIIDWNVWFPEGIKSHVITIAVSIPYKPNLITIWYHSIYYIPIGSMYAIYGNIYHQYTPNVSIYTIHGSYGIWKFIKPSFRKIQNGTTLVNGLLIVGNVFGRLEGLVHVPPNFKWKFLVQNTCETTKTRIDSSVSGINMEKSMINSSKLPSL